MTTNTTYLITTAQPSVKENINARRNKYLFAMSLRTLCFIGCIVLPVALGWKITLALGAIILPYIAIVVANTVLPAKTKNETSLYSLKTNKELPTK
jgi:hypothetical protein